MLDETAIAELKALYKEADDIISTLIAGRMHTNRELEAYAYIRMEGFLVATMQTISCLLLEEEERKNDRQRDGM